MMSRQLFCPLQVPLHLEDEVQPAYMNTFFGKLQELPGYDAFINTYGESKLCFLEPLEAATIRRVAWRRLPENLASFYFQSEYIWFILTCKGGV